ncbi:MAG: hypothetical protein WCH10_03895 [bacterium]
MSVIPDILYSMPNTLLFIIMCIAGIIFTVIGIHLIRAVIPMELRLKDNVAIGYISANTAVLFAVLAGFVISYMLGNFSRAQEITRIEVHQLNDICRDALRLDESTAREIQNGVKNYLEVVIQQEWPEIGKVVDSSYGEKILTSIRTKLIRYKTKDINQSLALADIHKGLEEVYNARSERLTMYKSALGTDIWIMLVIVTLFTIIINFVYGMEHYLHLILAPIVSTTVISLLFIIIIIDQPFRGGVSVTSKEFQGALATMRLEESISGT